MFTCTWRANVTRLLIVWLSFAERLREQNNLFYMLQLLVRKIYFNFPCDYSNNIIYLPWS